MCVLCLGRLNTFSTTVGVIILCLVPGCGNYSEAHVSGHIYIHVVSECFRRTNNIVTMSLSVNISAQECSVHIYGGIGQVCKICNIPHCLLMYIQCDIYIGQEVGCTCTSRDSSGSKYNSVLYIRYMDTNLPKNPVLHVSYTSFTLSSHRTLR